MNLTIRGLGISPVMIVITMTLLTHSAWAQKPSEKKTQRPLDQWPMECEGASARLDFAVIDTKKEPI